MSNCIFRGVTLLSRARTCLEEKGGKTRVMLPLTTRAGTSDAYTLTPWFSVSHKQVEGVYCREGCRRLPPQCIVLAPYACLLAVSVGMEDAYEGALEGRWDPR